MNTSTETQGGVITQQLNELGKQNSVDRDKPVVKVFYTKENVSGFSYDEIENTLDVRHYSQDGEFLRRTHEKPNLKNHYTEVKELRFPLGNVRTQPENVDKHIPSVHLESIYKYFNTVMPSEITDKIKIGGIDIEHSSISVGDMIQIDDSYFVITGMGFSRVEF